MTQATLREQAYHSFTRHLLANELKPGQFVSQRELVALTGMPLGAIRELIPRLEAEGLITTIPQRGMQIAPINMVLVREAYQLRLALEVEAVARFTETASDAVVADIKVSHEEILRTIERSGPTPDLDDHAQHVDWGFHELIIDQLRNDIISKVYRVNSIKIRLIRQELHRITGHVIPAMQEHMRIIHAIEARDPAEAAQALRDHIHTARDRALSLS